MLYRMPDSNRSREEGLVFLLHDYVLLRGNIKKSTRNGTNGSEFADSAFQK